MENTSNEESSDERHDHEADNLSNYERFLVNEHSLAKIQDLKSARIKNKQLKIASRYEQIQESIETEEGSLSDNFLDRIATIQNDLREKQNTKNLQKMIRDRLLQGAILHKAVLGSHEKLDSENKKTLELLKDKQHLCEQVVAKRKNIWIMESRLLELRIKLDDMIKKRREMITEISKKQASVLPNSSKSVERKHTEIKIKKLSKLVSMISHILHCLIGYSGINWSEDDENFSILVSCAKPLEMQLEEV